MALKFRRGTTAQKSGSLAFGEPYVNTTLGTLQIGGDTGDITLASSTGGGYATTGSNTFIGNQTITGSLAVSGDFTLGGNITIGDTTTDSVVINADLSSSLIPNDDNAFDIGSTSKRYRNVYAQSISASVSSNLTGSVNKIAYFSAENKVQDVGIFRVLNNGATLGIGTTAFDAGNPERFIVEAPNTSFNIATFQTINNSAYAQFNIKNTGSGSAASADLVLWNDQGTESSSYVDLGINSSNYSAGNVGFGGDGYLINAANDLYIGSIVSGSHGHVHLYGGNLWKSSSLSIYNDGTIGINTDKLDNTAASIPTAGFAVEVSGGVKFNNSIEVTGSVRATSFVGSIGATNGVVSGSSQLIGILTSLNTFSSSQDTKNTTLATYTASLETKNTTLATYTASVSGHITDINTKTGSFEAKFTTLQTLTASVNAQVSRLQESTASLNLYTSSNDTKFSTLATYTGSNDTTNTTQNTRLTRLEEATSSLNSLTGSYARTNTANIFTGNQTITGSLFITQDLVVQGSSSIQTISSSRLDIGDNIIQLNVNSPSLRFGGLAINDSGSAGSSGSFLYDSVEDEFIFVHKGNGTNVTSSHFVLGPETYDDLGNEIYPTQNRVVKSLGYEHIGDSNITDTGTLITLGSNTIVNGTLVASGTTLVSASAQVVGILSSLNTYTGSNDTTNTAQNSRLTNLETTTSSLATTYEGRATATKTIFSGSSQVDHNSTTNYVANRHIDHTAVSISAGNGLTGGGDISATRTLTLDTTSATFTTGVTTQNNALGVVSGSKTISGITLGSNLATLTIGTGLSGTSYNGSTGVTIANTGVLSVTTNTGLSTNASATGNITITNTGVTSITGTSNQVVASASTGGVTLSLPQSIATTSNVQFNSLGIGGAASGTAGRIDAWGDVVAYSSSDKNFKENITPIENPIEKIRKISGNTYDWKTDLKDVHGYEGNDVGVIAQEIEEVLPQIVTTRENGYKAVKYEKLVALLIEGIKSQQNQIDSLTIQVEELKRQRGL